MKKIIILLVLSCMLTGCSMGNQKIVTDYEFNKAMIKLADDTVITVDVESYLASDNSVIIITEQGTKYGVAYTDVTFYKE